MSDFDVEVIGREDIDKVGIYNILASLQGTLAGRNSWCREAECLIDDETHEVQMCAIGHVGRIAYGVTVGDGRLNDALNDILVFEEYLYDDYGYETNIGIYAVRRSPRVSLFIDILNDTTLSMLKQLDSKYDNFPSEYPVSGISAVNDRLGLDAVIMVVAETSRRVWAGELDDVINNSELKRIHSLSSSNLD